MQNIRAQHIDTISRGFAHSVEQFRIWIKFTINRQVAHTKDKTTLGDLARLHETSPHLLEDIGFAQDMCLANPETETWVLGDIQFTVLHPDDTHTNPATRTACAKAQGFRG